jgi:hypothetical protein
MKILIASHAYIIELNREKLRELAQLSPDIEVTIVVPKKWRPGGVMNHTIETQPINEGNFRVVPLTNYSQNNQGLLSFGPELITLLKTFRPDVIQVEQGVKSLAYAQMITLNKLLGLKAKMLFFTSTIPAASSSGTPMVTTSCAIEATTAQCASCPNLALMSSFSKPRRSQRLQPNMGFNPRISSSASSVASSPKRD